MGFSRKAWYVANGNMANTPVGLCFSSIVSKDSVCLVFFVDALNNLNVFTCDICNAYLNSPCCEKIWSVARNTCDQSLEWKV